MIYENDLSVLDGFITGDQTSKLLSSSVCSIQSSMCFAMEGLMTSLFTPPGCDWSDEETTNSIVETAPPKAPLSAHKVCSLWKKKRKAEKKKLLAMREEIELQSQVKRTALGIQRSFERRASGEDSDEERQRASYEKDGSRADFIRDQRQF